MINMQLSQAAEVLDTAYHGDNVSFHGCSTDTRTIKAQELFIALPGENFDGYDYISQAKDAAASAVITEKQHDVSISSILVTDPRRAMGELARHWRANFAIPLVAITGSNGKTTVKEMLTAILSCEASVLATQGNLNNDLGVPLTLFSLADEHQYAVIEMGANHKGEIAWLTGIAQPTVAVLTQCAPAHLEGFGSVEGVAHGKSEIFTGLVEQGVAVINGDDDFVDLWLEKSMHVRQLTFGLKDSNTVTATSIQLAADKSYFNILSPAGEITVSLNLPGRHNIMNALAATACAIALGIATPIIRQGLETVRPIKGRLQIRSGRQGCRIIDDTYNANPRSLESALAALSNFPGRHWLVLGDMGELGDKAQELHIHAGKISKQAGVERLYTLGELTKFSAQAFGEGAYHASDQQHLATLLSDQLTEDVTILIKGSRAMRLERLLATLGEE